MAVVPVRDRERLREIGWVAKNKEITAMTSTYL
jgi:hypothetical protein